LDEVAELDVLHWKPARKFDLLTANLFSDTLILAAPRLARALRVGGALIFSGVLREQFAEVEEAFRRVGLLLEEHNPRGKWVFGLARKVK
jgi:ribosomal protein L11 methyltransferase